MEAQYGLKEAARFLKVDPSQLRRWVQGYVRIRPGGKVTEREPALRRGVSGEWLTLPDLVELRVIKEYSRAGVSLEAIVSAAKALEKTVGPHPFAQRRLPTDGRSILMDLEEGYSRPETGQGVFAFISDFFKDIRFDDGGVATEWKPMPEREIWLSSHHSFGAPSILHGLRRIPTQALALPVENGDSPQVVAELYEIPPPLVESALEFHKWLKQAA